MNLSDAVTAVTALLGSVEGVTMLPKPPNPPKAGAGYLLPSQITPSDSFTTCDAVLEAAVFLGADLAASVQKFNSLSVPVVKTLTDSDLGLYAVSAEFELNGDGAYYLALNMTLEVD